MQRPLLGIIIRLITMIMLAAMFAFVKLAGEAGVHVTESLFYRQLFAIPVIILFLRGHEKGWQAIRSNRHAVHIFRMCIGLCAMALNFWAVTLLPLATSTTIGFTVPIFATFLAGFLLREQVGIRRWLAVIIGFCGVFIVVQPGSADIPLSGAIVALSGALLTAGVTLVIRVLGRTEQSITTIFWFSIYSMVPLGVLAFIFGGNHDAQAWGYILGLSFFGAAVQLGITQSLRLAPVSTVLPMDYTSLIWASIFGILIFGNWPGLSLWLGAPVIIGSGLFIAWREHLKSGKELAKSQ